MPRNSGRQTRLSFTPASSSPRFEHSPTGPSEAPTYRGQLRLHNYSFESRVTRSSARKLDNNENESLLPTPGKSSQVQSMEDGFIRPKSLSPPKILVEEISSDEDAVQAPTRRTSRIIAVDSESDLSDIVSLTSRKRKAQYDQHVGSNQTPLKQRLRSHRVGSSGQNCRCPSGTRSPPQTRSATRRQGITDSPILALHERRAKSSAMCLSDLASEETSDADELVSRPLRQKQRGPAFKNDFVVDDHAHIEDSDDDLVISSPAKRRKRDSAVKSPHTPQKDSEQERIDLEEDLQALQDSAVTKTRTRGHAAGSSRVKRQKQLEMLRRKRAGETGRNTTESDGEIEDPKDSGVSAGETSFEPSREIEDSDVEPEIPVNEDLDQYEDDFVQEDTEGELGAPPEMPFEFTSSTYKEPKDYFQDVVEWMVHNKLNPAFPRSELRYRYAVTKLEDEVNGRTGSQLMSSTWSDYFRRALTARPFIEVTAFPIRDGSFCDACNRSGHPASFDIKLHGKTYSRQTLEPLSDDDSEFQDEREWESSSDLIPDGDTRFLLGRHCKAKATLAHTLIHWRFHLNEWVIGYLEHRGILADSKIIERSRWRQKRQEKYADEIVGMMIENGEVAKLWRDFRLNLKQAREMKEIYW